MIRLYIYTPRVYHVFITKHEIHPKYKKPPSASNDVWTKTEKKFMIADKFLYERMLRLLET